MNPENVSQQLGGQSGGETEGHGYPSPESRWGRALLPAAILLATFLAYVDTLALGFVFDDHVLIVTNDSIRSWRYFPTYFTSHIWAFRYPHLLANYYRPLFLTWLRLCDVIFGLQRPWGWHLGSVLAHVAVTYLVYRLAVLLTKDRWVAGVAGLLFGLHPVHAEAVADITSIQEPLSTIFILGAVLAFARSRKVGDEKGIVPVADSTNPSGARPGSGNGLLAAALALTAAALLSKESGMVVPALIFCFAWIYEGSGGREVASGDGGAGLIGRTISALMASIPFWLVVLLYVPARIRALKGFAHVITPMPLSTVIFTIPSVLVFYLRLVFWPSGLSCYYDTPSVSSPGFATFFAPSLVLIALVAAVLIWYARAWKARRGDARAIAFATVLTVLTIVPVLNFRFLPEGELAHDRYVYLPSVGFVILTAMAVRALGRKFKIPTHGERRTKGENFDASRFGRLGWVLAVLFFAALGLITARQNIFWSDDLTLNYRAHEIAPRNVYATTSLAAAVAGRGMDGAAMALYQQALSVQPRFWRANVNLGYLEYGRGDYPEAVRYFAIACDADPTDGDQFLYLGMSLLRQGRFDEAEKAVRAGLLVRPEGKDYHLGLGMVLKAEGKLAEARQEFDAELAADPQDAQAGTLLDQVTLEIGAGAAKSGAGKP